MSEPISRFVGNALYLDTIVFYELLHQTKLISELYPQPEPQLTKLYRFPHLLVHEITFSDLAAMQSNMRQYHLLPRDALHLAAMQKCRCFQLVSHDNDFDMVPLIQRYTLS